MSPNQLLSNNIISFLQHYLLHLCCPLHLLVILITIIKVSLRLIHAQSHTCPLLLHYMLFLHLTQPHPHHHIWNTFTYRSFCRQVSTVYHKGDHNKTLKLCLYQTQSQYQYYNPKFHWSWLQFLR